MIFIFLSIIFNAYIGSIFKHFPTWKVDAKVAVVINYWVCVFTGMLFLQTIPFSINNIQADWFLFSILLGAMFFTLFNIIAISSLKIGITLTQAAGKMSLAIPVLFSLYLYKEDVNLPKVLGVILALVAVYFITQPKTSEGQKVEKTLWLLPVLFFGSGIIDTILKFVETSFIKENETLHHFIIHIFAAAAVIGAAYLSYLFSQKKVRINRASIIAGIMLGVPNYFSIYFIIRALQFKDLNSSSIFPINNIGVLVLVTLYGFFIFKERLSTKNKIGLTLALLSILLLIFGG